MNPSPPMCAPSPDSSVFSTSGNPSGVKAVRRGPAFRTGLLRTAAGLALAAWVLGAGTGCTRSHRTVETWRDMVPVETVFAYLPTDGEPADRPPLAPYAFALRDPASRAAEALRLQTASAGERGSYLALLMIADRSDDLSPLWIFNSTSDPARPDAAGGEDAAQEEPASVRFTTSTYAYRGVPVSISGSDHEPLRIYAARIGGYELISPSPRAVELALDRALDGPSPGGAPADGIGEGAPSPEGAQAAALSSLLERAGPGDLLLGVSRLDDWFSTFSAVIHHPALSRAFEGAPPIRFVPARQGANRGTGPSSALTSAAGSPAETLRWRLGGTMALPDGAGSHGTVSTLASAMGATEDDVVLDRYIPRNAVAYALIRISSSTPDAEIGGSGLPDDLLDGLGDEFVLAAMAESGFGTGSETLFLREITDARILQNHLEEMVQEGRAQRNGLLYTLDDHDLWRALTPVAPPVESTYSLDVLQNAAVLSVRSGLTSIVRSESSRRNVVRYDPAYLARLETDEPRYSFLAHAERDGLAQWLAPVLHPQARADLFLPDERSITLVGRRAAGADTVSLVLQAHAGSAARRPYVERWIHNLPLRQLTSRPVLADIGGTSRDEVIFTTLGGTITALATDGTAILRVDTGEDVPVGAPVAFDWYRTRQSVLLQAAGSSIYGWDRNGSVLPGFPIALPETAVGDLLVADLTRDGLPELVAATADRSVHLLDARGTPLPGWPKRINTPVTAGPVIIQTGGSHAVLAVSDNTLHGWTVSGAELPGLPFFAASPFLGTPVQVEGGRLLAATVDGVAMIWNPDAGPGSMPSELPARAGDRNTIDRLELIRLSDTGLAGMPVAYNGLEVLEPSAVRDSLSASNLLDPDSTVAPARSPEGTSSSGSIRADVLLAGTPEGGVLLFDQTGRLLFTASLGQPASELTPPAFADLFNDGSPEIVAVGRFGRLYAWNPRTGQPVEGLPPNGIDTPVFTDLNGDGTVELIALTREGLRCWTLNRP